MFKLIDSLESGQKIVTKRAGSFFTTSWMPGDIFYYNGACDGSDFGWMCFISKSRRSEQRLDVSLQIFNENFRAAES